MLIACWIINATRAYGHTHAHTPGHFLHTYTHYAGTHAHAHIHTEKYLILVAFPRQQTLRESASVLLRYTYIVCLLRKLH